MLHISYAVHEDCMNINSYGEICVHCNCCGRFGKEGMKEAQIKYWNEMLSEAETFDQWFEDEWKEIQEANQQRHISYCKAKLAELMEVE